MNYWHLQMSQGLVDGENKTKSEIEDILKNNNIIGTGEWEDNRTNQCRTFKEQMCIGDIVMVRYGKLPLALVQVISDNMQNYIYENARKIKILSLYTEKFGVYSGQTRGTLERVNNKNSETAKFIINWYNQILNNMESQRIVEILKVKKQIILQGAPGTGKTYTTAAVALSILGVEYDSTNHQDIMLKYRQLENKQIFFTTFHQSMDYEDFVEGLKPEVVDGGIVYKVENGVFKLICQEAENDLKEEDQTGFETKLKDLRKDCINLQNAGKYVTLRTREGAEFNLMYEVGNDKYFFVRPLNSVVVDPKYYLPVQNIKSYYAQKDNTLNYLSYIIPVVQHLNIIPVKEKKKQNYVLIIDEINRGNISKIFGELITLLESDKRKDGDHHLDVILPYSKKSFEVPSNLYIIGTMNTTDRSVGHIDYAVRRRFAFYTIKSSKDAIDSFYNRMNENDLKMKALQVFEGISKYIEEKKSPDLDLEDLMVGHSYFMARSLDELKLKLEYEIIPLLKEYEKDGLITLNGIERKELGQDWINILR